MDKNILGNKMVVQVGLLVNDIEKTSQKYADFFGVDQPSIAETGSLEEANTTYMGKKTKARAKLAFFDVGENLQIELIEPDHEPSTWRADLDKNGEGFHHLAFFIKGMKEKITLLEKNNIQLLQTGEWDGGRYAYLDANEDLKVVLELLEID